MSKEDSDRAFNRKSAERLVNRWAMVKTMQVFFL